MKMVLVDKDKLIDFILNSKPSERQAPSQIMQALNPIPADGLIEAVKRFPTEGETKKMSDNAWGHKVVSAATDCVNALREIGEE